MLAEASWILSLRYVKAALDLQTADRDFMLKELIGNMSEFIQEYLGYNLMDQTYTHDGTTLVKLDGTGTRSLFVENRPVITVTSAGVHDEVDVDTTDVDEFVFYADRGEMRLTDGRCWTRGSQNVALVYRAGYTTYDASHTTLYGITMPGPIRQVALELVSRKNQEITKGGPQITEIRVGDSAVSFTINELTVEQRGMLRPYMAVGRLVG